MMPDDLAWSNPHGGSEATLPSTQQVAAALARLGLARAWVVAHDAIMWLAPTPDGERLHVAAVNVDSPALQEAAERLHTAPATFVAVEPATLKPYLAELSADRIHDAGPNASQLRELAEEAPIVDFVNAMLGEAAARRASDVHIEPFEDRLSVRFRVDGVMSLWRNAPRTMFEAVASRIKILSGMDIAERRRPQDGRQTLQIAGVDSDVRVSALPTTWGESIVLRFLGRQSGLPSLEDLGLTADQQRTMSVLTGAGSGMILVSGPTGSGKTTTVYRLVADLNDGMRKIVTVEDPVEVDLPGVLQMQARPDIGLTFASGLRAILRQDPNVIFVGEIRDAETAAIATQAALTGHLVISTIHTTTALASVTRLMDLGVERYFLADVLRGMVGQRLVRRLCPHCSTPVEGDAEEALARTRLAPELLQAPANWRAPVGCPQCAMTGYRGRIGVFEIAAVDSALRAEIHAGGDEAHLESCAHRHGFRTAFEDGLLKARAGLTSMREVQRTLAGQRL